MKKAMLLLVVVAWFFLASYPASAAGGWWNESWHFRVPVNASFPSIASNAVVNASVNFTSILNGLNITGTFDKNSIRVVQNNSDIPSDFYNTSLAAGNVSWIANGTTPANTNRTFYIYFDIMENGAKAQGKIISESCNSYGNNTCYWRSGYTNNNNVWSNQSAPPGLSYEWNRSWAQMIEISWKWSAESGFDNAWLYADGAFYSQKTASGSETVQISASRVSARFTSDSSNIVSATDSYGTYGTAVDTIRFYPTASVTTPPFTASQSAAQKQYSPSLSNASVSATGGWGGTFNYTVNVSDPENDNVSVTLFTNENGAWNRKSTQIANGTFLNWTVSPFSCSDIGPINYMFEYNDSSRAPVNSSNFSQTLDKDSITLEYYSGNASVNREGNDNITFGIRLNDTDRMAYVSGQTVNFWAYYSNAWNNIGTNTTMSAPSGAALYNFNPGCSVEANAHQWKANYTGTCYKTNESADFIFTALGQLRNYLILPGYLATYDLGNAVPIEANITDECSNAVGGATVNLTVNTTNQEMADQYSGKYNYSWSSSGKATGNYIIQINASRLFHNFNLTSWLNWFALVAGPPQINISLNASQAAQNTIVLINASVEDMSSTGISWVRANVTYPNSTVALYNMTNNSGMWQTILNDTLRRGQHNITVYAADNAGKTGNSTTGLKIYANLNVNVSVPSILTQSSDGRFRVAVNDSAGAPIAGASVNIILNDPYFYMIFNSTYYTDSNGKSSPLDRIIISSTEPPGYYAWQANASFNDALANIVVNKSVNGSILVGNEQYMTDVIVSPIMDAIAGDSTQGNLSITLTVLGKVCLNSVCSIVNIDPDSANTTLRDPLGNIISQGSTVYSNISMDRLDAGIYSKKYATSSSSTKGSWEWTVYLAKNSSAIELKLNEYLKSSLFDLGSIAILNSAADQLQISAVASNMGTADEDAVISWTLNRTDTNQPLNSGTETKKINANSNLTYTISPSNPSGYAGEAKIRFVLYYGPSFSQIAVADRTFSITSPSPPAPQAPPAVGGGAPSAPAANVSNVSAAQRIEISEYPAEIEIERGWAKFITVSLNNTGSGILHNVSVRIKDIPQEWSEIQTAPAAQMSGSQTFLVRFSVPGNVSSGNYRARIAALSAEASDEKDIIIRIFASKEELIKYQIETIREKMSALQALTDQTERDGKDVRAIRGGIADISAQIGVAENYLNNKKYDDASNAVYTIKEMISTLRGDLESLRREKSEAPLISWMLIAIIGLVASLAAALAYFYRKIKGNEALAMQKFYEMKRMILGRTSGAGLRSDMEKTRRMIRLIQKEYDEGLITKETYQELKRTSEEKLLALSKKMSDLGLKE